MAAGFKATSGSTVSLWERARRPIKRVHLYRLARFYGVPPSFFTHPQKTDEERLTEALAVAEALEREDWEQGQEDDPEDADEPGDGRNRLH